MIQEGGFWIWLAARWPFGKPDEFENVRIAQKRRDVGDSG
jgi:hypothetical protein